MLKSEVFTRSQVITANIDNAVKYENSLMDSNYDDSVIVSSKQHADIWSPFTFVFSFKDKSKLENKGWIEILIYRNGHEVFKLPKSLNQTILDKDILQEKEQTKIFRYEAFNQGKNIINTWMEDNNITGYTAKESINIANIKILSLYHKEEQLKSIQPRRYLESVNLNNLGSKFDNSFTESRIYYEDFEYLFPKEFKYVGLTTGSWNLKYIGLNPIDELHKWPAIRQLDDDLILCSDTEPTRRFFAERKTVLHNVFNEITFDLIKEFLLLINLKTDYEDLQTPVSNQIIAKREIVKSLFDFYQQNEILHKIQFFMNKYKFTVKNTVYGKDVYARRSGFFAETATSLWINQSGYKIAPQEILKTDWYK